MKRLIIKVLFLAVSVQLQAQQIFTLADCRQMATNHNKEVQMATEKVKAAESLRKAARTQYLPNFAANGGYIRNQKNMSLLGEDQYLPVLNYTAAGAVNYAGSWNNGWNLVNGSPVPLDANSQPFDPKANPEKIVWKNQAYIPKDAFEVDMKNIYVGAVTLTQPLFLGGKIRELNRMADSGKKLAEAQQQSEISETIVNTDAAYWRIVSLINKEKLAKSYVALLQKLDTNLEKSVSFGVATKSDALFVKVKLNEAEMSLLQVEDGLTLSRMALCQVCGLPMNTSFSLQDETLDSLHISPDGVPLTGASVYDRPEIKSLEQLVNMADASKKIAESRFMPNAALTAGYTVSNPNLYDGIQNTFGGSYQIGVVVNVPLFHFGERVHTLHAAQSEKAIANLKLEDAKEKVELDIMQARFRNDESAKKAYMTTSNKAKAEENLHYANIGFEAGTITASTLMEAQTAWLKANSENIDAQIDVQLCRVYLQKALGNLF
ncbi:MAG TPA: TolC family protein [Bacteroidales bacterium]|nr:TolC family protein [Bacteroidales bacterium]